MCFVTLLSLYNFEGNCLPLAEKVKVSWSSYYLGAVEEYIVTSILWRNKTESLLRNDLLNGPVHSVARLKIYHLARNFERDLLQSVG